MVSLELSLKTNFATAMTVRASHSVLVTMVSLSTTDTGLTSAVAPLYRDREIAVLVVVVRVPRRVDVGRKGSNDRLGLRSGFFD
jgi:ABC-type tungstate transport system permease subunit